MELTCSVKNFPEVKTLNDESVLNNNHRRFSTIITPESARCDYEMSAHVDHPNTHPLDVDKENMILDPSDIRKKIKNCHSIEVIPADCKSSSLRDQGDLSLAQKADNKCCDQTFNSHESTFMVDRHNNLQLSPFFHLASHSANISEKKDPLNLQSQNDVVCKKFQIPPTKLSSLCKLSSENNLRGNIPCYSPNNKLPQTKQPSNEVDSISSKNSENISNNKLAPFNSKESKLNMPPMLKQPSQTPGAVYNLRKKRKQISDTFLKECVLSSELECVLRKSGKFYLKQPYTDMKVHCPVNYNRKKSSSFCTFRMDGSFTEESKENVLSPTVQTIHSRLPTINRNSGMLSIVNTTPASDNALMKSNLTSESKENNHLPKVLSFNLSPKTTNISGMTSFKSLTPAPTSAFTSFVKPVATSSDQINIVALSEEKAAQNLFHIDSEHKSMDFSAKENDSLQLLPDSILETTDGLSCLQEKSLQKNDSKLVLTSKQDIKLSEVSDLNEVKNNMKNSIGIMSIPMKQKGNGQKDPSFKCKPETPSLEMKFNDQDIIKNKHIPKNCNEGEADMKLNEEFTLLEERDLKDVSSNLNMHENLQFKESKNLERPDLKSARSAKTPKAKNLDFPKANDPAALEKSIISDKNSNISCVSKSVLADLQGGSCTFISENATNENELLEQSESQLKNKTFMKENSDILINSKDINKIDIQRLSNCKPKVNIHQLQKESDVIDSKKPIVLTEALTKFKKLSEVLNSDIFKESHSNNEVEPSNQSVVNIPAINEVHKENLLKNSNNTLTGENLCLPEKPLNLELTNFESIASEKNYSFKQKDVADIQNISFDQHVSNNHEEKYNTCELNTSSNEVSNQFIASVSGNSLCKINSELKFPTSEKGTNDEIWKTSISSEFEEDKIVQANEPDASNAISCISTSECCVSYNLEELESLRQEYEEASKGTHWKLESLDDNEAVFKLEWAVWFYKCVIAIHVSNTNLAKSNVTLMSCIDEPDDEYESLGYKCFEFLTKQDISLSIFNEDITKKLAYYSNTAERVETLMRDIMHISIDQVYTLSNDLDPLVLAVEVLNDNYMSQLLITFHINLHTYPSERIIPEVKHLKCNDIVEKVKEAITKVEPGEDYLWNMIKLASEL